MILMVSMSTIIEDYINGNRLLRAIEWKSECANGQFVYTLTRTVNGKKSLLVSFSRPNAEFHCTVGTQEPVKGGHI